MQTEEEESKDGALVTEKDALRGGQDLNSGAFMPNFMFVVGSSPGTGVKKDTKLIRDVLTKFKESFNKRTLMLNFPEVMQQFQGTDTKAEIITSSMLQPMRISIGGYKIKDASVYIFV